MGTRGLYVFIYKGKYYVFYNQMDSYPEALGQVLVTMIKTENYKKWGDILIDKIDNGNYKIRKLKGLHGKYIEVEIENDRTKESQEKIAEEDEDECFMKKDEWIKHSFTRTDQFIYTKWNIYDLVDNSTNEILIENGCPTLLTSTPEKCENEEKLEELSKYYDWTYILDLDNEIFKIPKTIIVFPFDKIPFDWKTYLN